MATVQQAPITIDEFVTMSDPEDGSRLELVRGNVVVRPPSKAKHGIACASIAGLLADVAYPDHLGWVACNNAGVILQREPDTLVGPDVAYWSISRQPTGPEGYFEIPPDIAVEVLSPDDRRKDVRDKVKDYLSNGVPLVWLIDPETRTVTVYQGNLRGIELDDSETLDGCAVLPGFTCKVAELFG